MNKEFFAGIKYTKSTIKNILYPYNDGLYNLDQKGNIYPLVNFQYFPVIWTVKDKSFICCQQRDGDPWNNESMVLSFNHNTKKLSKYYEWGEITPPDADSHLMPTIIGTNDDKILLLEENPHNGPIYIKKSDLNFDISNYFNIGTFGNDLAYPHTNKFKNGDLYSVYRGSGYTLPGINYTRIDSYKSTTNGDSWEYLGPICYFEGTLEDIERWYPQTPYSTDKMCVFINRRITRDGIIAFPYLYYMESYDGVTWYDITGKHKWNIANGVIPIELLNDKFLVLKYNNGIPNQYGSIKATGSCIDNYNNPIAVIREEGSYRARLLIWQNQWVSKLISIPGRQLVQAETTPIIVTKDNRIRLFITEIIEGFTHIVEIESNNFGDSWIWKRQITTGNINFVNPHLSGNFQDLGYGILGCVAKVNENYSDLFVKEIM